MARWAVTSGPAVHALGLNGGLVVALGARHAFSWRAVATAAAVVPFVAGHAVVDRAVVRESAGPVVVKAWLQARAGTWNAFACRALAAAVAVMTMWTTMCQTRNTRGGLGVIFDFVPAGSTWLTHARRRGV